RPRRPVAGQGGADGPPVLVELAADRRVEAEERADAQDARAIVRLRRADGFEAVRYVRVLVLDPADERRVVGVHVDDARRRVSRDAAPVDAAGAARELDR